MCVQHYDMCMNISTECKHISQFRNYCWFRIILSNQYRNGWCGSVDWGWPSLLSMLLSPYLDFDLSMTAACQMIVLYSLCQNDWLLVFEGVRWEPFCHKKRYDLKNCRGVNCITVRQEYNYLCATSYLPPNVPRLPHTLADWELGPPIQMNDKKQIH